MKNSRCVINLTAGDCKRWLIFWLLTGEPKPGHIKYSFGCKSRRCKKHDCVGLKYSLLFKQHLLELSQTLCLYCHCAEASDFRHLRLWPWFSEYSGICFNNAMCFIVFFFYIIHNVLEFYKLESNKSNKQV